jgi:hypothetical protein
MGAMVSALEPFFDDLVESIAPDDSDLIMFFKSYFDESYDDTI